MTREHRTLFKQGAEARLYTQDFLGMFASGAKFPWIQHPTVRPCAKLTSIRKYLQICELNAGLRFLVM